MAGIGNIRRTFSWQRADQEYARKVERKAAKFWLVPVRLDYNRGFGSTELKKITALVHEHEAGFAKAWHDYFKPGN